MPRESRTVQRRRLGSLGVAGMDPLGVGYGFGMVVVVVGTVVAVAVTTGRATTYSTVQ